MAQCIDFSKHGSLVNNRCSKRPTQGRQHCIARISVERAARVYYGGIAGGAAVPDGKVKGLAKWASKGLISIENVFFP
jgi:hypothetical protein